MRRLITYLSCLATLGLMYLDQPEKFTAMCREFIQCTEASLDQFWYDKDIRVSGAQTLSTRELLSQLPLENSTPWWFTNSSVLEAALRQNPFVLEADVQSCPSFFELIPLWGCFQINVTEREIKFLAKHGDAGFAVGQDGAVVVSLPDGYIDAYFARSIGGDGAQTPVLDGLFDSSSSADVVRARFTLMQQAIRVLESSTSEKISYLALRSEDEISVKFAGRDCSIVVGFPVTHEGLVNEDELADMGRRYAALARYLGPQLEQIETIDLAFDKIAVVRPKASLRPKAISG